MPVGAFYLFLDFESHREQLATKGITDSTTMCERLLEETGVAILPGESFARPKEELTARLAYVDFDGARALAASETIPIDQPLPDDFTDSWCHKVIEATGRICEWVDKLGTGPTDGARSVVYCSHSGIQDSVGSLEM